MGDSLGGELGGALAVAEASTASATSAASPPRTVAPDNENTVSFVLMTRKGNKPQFKNLAVPSDSELAQNLKNREEVMYSQLRKSLFIEVLTLLGRKSGKRTREKINFGLQ